MAKVYFIAVDSYAKTAEISAAAAKLLQTIHETDNVELNSFIPLKVHMGEKGNTTYIEAKNFNGIIDYLTQKSISCAYIETNVVYTGQRNTSESHLKLAKEHGFTNIPVVIADGDVGEECEMIEINKKNFVNCRIAKKIARVSQIIVLSHFKGHGITGFAGAIKQLGMGCASKGGKLAQHADAVPTINTGNCRSCKACIPVCPVGAITVPNKAVIDKNKCVGCVSCVSACKYNAITISWQASFSNTFNERLAEYALAAAKGKHNIYINFALNITRSCDCDGQRMQPIAKDLGVFASVDPVAVDQACLDLLDKNEGKTIFANGRYTLDYAAQIGLGSKNYELIRL